MGVWFENNFITLLTQLLLRVKRFNSCVSNSEHDIGFSKYIYIDLVYVYMRYQNSKMAANCHVWWFAVCISTRTPVNKCSDSARFELDCK